MKKRRILSLITCGAVILGSVFCFGEKTSFEFFAEKSKPEKGGQTEIVKNAFAESGAEDVFVLPTGEKADNLEALYSGETFADSRRETDAPLEEVLPFEEVYEEPIENVGYILDRKNGYETEIKTEEYFVSRYAALSSTFVSQIESKFYDAVISCNDTLSISSYSISQNEANTTAIYNLLQSFVDKYPELFNVKSMGLSFNAYTGKYLSVNLQYHYSKTEYDKKMSVIDDEVEAHFGDLFENNSLTDLQKALIVHDRIALICEYDEESFNQWENYKNKANEAYTNGDTALYEQYEALAMESIPPESYNMYGTLNLEISVCQGYSKTYQYILEKLGIDSYLCASNQLFHVWNIIEIENEYYHVDITWDDPVHDIYGQVLHDNFLVSTDKISETHEATDFDETPDDDTFDDAFWGEIETAFQVLEGEVYYIDPTASGSGFGAIYNWDNEKIHSIGAKWEVGNGYYNASYSRLAEFGGKLYYNTSDTVYSFDPNGQSRRIYEPENIGESLIYGFKIDHSKGVVQLKENRYSEAYQNKVFHLSGEPSFELNYHQKQASKGENFTLEILNFNANGTTAKVGDAEWTSSDSSVATVNQMGRVTIRDYGKATITCRILDTEIHCYIVVPAPNEFVFSDATINIPELSDRTYNGAEHKPTFEVYYGSQKLVLGNDYEISYQNNVNVGEASVILDGKGSYVGRIVVNFNILPLEITDELETQLKRAIVGFYSEKTFYYNGSAQTPFPTLSIFGKELQEGKDYLLTFQNNVEAGEATVSFVAIGNFSGNYTVNFNIERKQIRSSVISGVNDKTYTGKDITLSLNVVLDGKTLVLGKDYKVKYSDNRETGKASVKISGIGNYIGEITSVFYIHPSKVGGIAQTSGNTSSIKISWKRIASGTGYAVLRATSKNGTYKTIALINKLKTTGYTDKKGIEAGKTYYYKIIAYKTVGTVKFTSVASEILKACSAPKAPKITSYKNKASKKAYLKWSKVSGAGGYEVYMSTKKSSGYKKIYSGSKLNFQKTKLKKNKTYYFKVRAYRKGSKTIYSSYSSVKSIKIKK